MKLCTIEGCGRQHLAKGMCGKHYKRVREGKDVHISHGVVDTTPEIKFWNRVDIKGGNECWEWQRGRHVFGYGLVTWDGATRRAHRIAYTLTKGAIPEGLVVRHSCDNPPCCNPSHLALGTPAQNNQDKIDRGRQARGEAANIGKLTEADVRKILLLRSQGVSLKRIAPQFGVTFSTIGHISQRRTWTHVTI